MCPAPLASHGSLRSRPASRLATPRSLAAASRWSNDPLAETRVKRPSQPRDYLKVQCGIVSAISDMQAVALNVTDHQIDLSKLVRHKPILKPVLEPSGLC